MRNFVVRRLVFAILSVIVATFVILALSRAAGDPLLLYATSGYGLTDEAAEQIRHDLGLDRNVTVQYALWLGNALRGDLGTTLRDRQDVTKRVMEKLPNTLQLAGVSWILATIVGIPLGVLSAVKRTSAPDYLGRVFAIFGQSVPQFWLGLVFVLIFAIQLQWLPPGTRGSSIWDIKYIVLPAVTLGLPAMAGYMRLTRTAMLEVLDSEYIRLARAKGVGNNVVIWKHAFKNALIQPLTASTLILTGFLTGSVVVEQIFIWPGMGQMAITAVNNNDFPLLQGTVFFFTILYVAMTFLTDLLYALIDPRIRYN
jgi:peptide/nickel transport system permease protein